MRRSLFRWCCGRPWCTAIVTALFMSIVVSAVVRAQSPATAPSTQPTTAPAAVLDKDVDPVADPSGANGATPAAKKGDPAPPGSLLVPNPFNGWPVYTTDDKTKATTPKTTGLTDDE